jgi:hypothetical protein
LKYGAVDGSMEDFSRGLFCPWSVATWLLTELDPEDPDIAFGLCDLGMGFRELGNVRLSEMADVIGPDGPRIERDRTSSRPKPCKVTPTPRDATGKSPSAAHRAPAEGRGKPAFIFRPALEDRWHPDGLDIVHDVTSCSADFPIHCANGSADAWRDKLSG